MVQITLKKLSKHIGHALTVNEAADFVYIWCEECDEKIYMTWK
jgi:hypothetical protein